MVDENQDSGPPPSGEYIADWRGLGYLIDLTTERVTTPVEGIHRAILDRWFRMAGPNIDPARRMADGATASIYQSIRLGGTALGTAVSAGAGLAGRYRKLRPLWETDKGRYVQSIFNGVWGDRFDEDSTSFSIELGLRDPDGNPVSTTVDALNSAFPEPKGRLVVMVHGFAETEKYWRHGELSSLTRQLEADGFSVLLLRYNTGRTIAANGSDLANLLDELRLAWPVPVTDIALVGHSMGGLVARSAVVAANDSGLRWAELSNNVVAIAAPHSGTPIEKAVAALSSSMGIARESRPLKTFLDQRSAGIQDLRYGIDASSDSLGSSKYRVVAGAITTAPTNPTGRAFGDLVVRVKSATGSGRRRKVPSTGVLVVGGRNHADLAHDPEVVSQIRTWLNS